MRLVASCLVATLLAIAFAALPGTASVARAASCVQISRIYYNSPGSDTGSATSLNAEWVQIKNRCSTARSITNWTLRDAARHVYRFGTFTLRAGASVKVHTGSGANTSTDRYWRLRWYIWNNTGDTATLRNAAGTTVDTCRYAGTGAWTYC